MYAIKIRKNNLQDRKILVLLVGRDKMTDDSSSEDEITKRILEDSIDTDLLTNDLYNNSNNKKTVDKMKSMIKLIM